MVAGKSRVNFESIGSEDEGIGSPFRYRVTVTFRARGGGGGSAAMEELMAVGEGGLVRESDGRRMEGHEIPMHMSQSMRERCIWEDSTW